jgi:hypothetical protein
MDIKPIETEYKGYRFRSRLEARWAVFFDALGVRYEYEKEGFELGGGMRYLPDFWLTDMNCFIEIKSNGLQPYSEDEQVASWKCGVLAAQSRKWVNLLIGDPYPDEYRIISFHENLIPDKERKYIDMAIEQGEYYMFLRILDGHYAGDIYPDALKKNPSWPAKAFSNPWDKQPYRAIYDRVICYHEKCGTMSFGYIDYMRPVGCLCERALHNCVDCNRRIKGYMFRCFTCESMGGWDDDGDMVANVTLMNAYIAARSARF